MCLSVSLEASFWWSWTKFGVRPPYHLRMVVSFCRRTARRPRREQFSSAIGARIERSRREQRAPRARSLQRDRATPPTTMASAEARSLGGLVCWLFILWRCTIIWTRYRPGRRDDMPPPPMAVRRWQKSRRTVPHIPGGRQWLSYRPPSCL